MSLKHICSNKSTEYHDHHWIPFDLEKVDFQSYIVDLGTSNIDNWREAILIIGAKLAFDPTENIMVVPLREV